MQNAKDQEKLQLPTVQPATEAKELNTNVRPFVVPQYLSAQQQYFAFNSAFFNAPFGQFAYATGQQYLPQLVATYPTIRTQLAGAKVAAPIATTTTTTTAAPTRKPALKEREPTTRKPQGSLLIKPPKLQLKPEENPQVSEDLKSSLELKATKQQDKPLETPQMLGDFKSDKALLKAVQKINPEYVIEEIVNIPGQHIYSTQTTEKLKTQQKQIKTQNAFLFSANEQKQKQVELIKKSKTQKKFKSKTTKSENQESGVKVEAIGKTSTKGNIPEIPFGTYFLPYFSQQQKQEQTGKKTAALILEPHSKAIVGNGGTAISTPISRAYLKRGVTTNVYFNPESVAIAGVGGKAHAQADLELDLIN